MTTTRRLLETGDALSGELRRALRGAPGDPNPAELQALAAKLGSALGVTLATPVVPPALSAKAAGIAGGAANKGLWAIVSWFLSGAAVGVGVCVVVIYGAAVQRLAPAPQVSVRLVTSASPRAMPAAAPLVNQLDSTARSAPLASSQGVAVPPHRSGEAMVTEPPTVGEARESEISLLHRAQQAVPRNPSEALALSELHAQQFPNGVFVQEREVIAIDSMLRLGRVAEARTRARAFNDRYPGSAHARRVQALLDEHAH